MDIDVSMLSHETRARILGHIREVAGAEPYERLVNLMGELRVMLIAGAIVGGLVGAAIGAGAGALVPAIGGVASGAAYGVAVGIALPILATIVIHLMTD